MPRTIQPELLDTLSPQDPDAVHSRRDLRLINRFMGNHRWIERTLRSKVLPGERVLEVGAGAGDLARRLTLAGVPTDGLDLLPPPDDWPPARAWHSVDLRSFQLYATYPVIVGNLIFHHLSDRELADLGAKIRRGPRLIVACEPIRSRRFQALFRVLAPLFGPSHVTMHDADVSIAGGFSGNELPQALGLQNDDWDIRCTRGLVGGYHMLATRRA